MRGMDLVYQLQIDHEKPGALGHRDTLFLTISIILTLVCCGAKKGLPQER